MDFNASNNDAGAAPQYPQTSYVELTSLPASDETRTPVPTSHSPSVFDALEPAAWNETVEHRTSFWDNIEIPVADHDAVAAGYDASVELESSQTDTRRFEFFDVCFVFPNTAHLRSNQRAKAAASVPKQVAQQLVRDVCSNRRANRSQHREAQRGADAVFSAYQPGSPHRGLDFSGFDKEPLTPVHRRASIESPRHSFDATKALDAWNTDDSTMGLTQADVLDLFRTHFIALLKKLPCYVREEDCGPLIYCRARLTEQAAKSIAGRLKYPLQLDISVVRKFQFMDDQPVVAPFLEFDMDAENAVRLRRATRKETRRLRRVRSTDSGQHVKGLKDENRTRFEESRGDIVSGGYIYVVDQKINHCFYASIASAFLGILFKPSPTVLCLTRLCSLLSLYLCLWQRYNFLGRKIHRAPYDKEDPSCTLFRPVDRIRLLLNALARNYNIDAMVSHGIMSGYFALHQRKLADQLLSEWAHLGNVKRGAQQPIADIREYFGESIAYYFAWLGHFTRSLVEPAAVGVVAAAAQLALRDPYMSFSETLSNGIGILYGFYVTCWAILFLKNWENKERRYCLEWGVESHGRQREQQRINQQEIPYSSKKGLSNWQRRCLSLLISIFFISFVIVVVCSVFALPYLLRTRPELLEGIRDYIPIITSLGNVTFIAVFDLIWCKVGYMLTTFENWKYEADFQQSLIFKLFVFRFFNYFNSFFYLAFVKNRVDPCPGGSCVSLMRWNLGFIFVSNFMFNFVEVGIPAVRYYIQRYLTRRHRFSSSKTAAEAFLAKEAEELEAEGESQIQTGGKDTASWSPSNSVEKPWQIEYAMATYDPIYGTLEDYMEIVLLFTFVTLFSIILPIIPFLTFLSSIVEIRTDALKLLGVHKRPYPALAPGIGAWKSMLQATCYIALGVNIGISIFTMEPAKFFSLTLSQKLATFTVAEHICFLIPVLLRFFVPTEAEEVAEIRERLQHILHDTIWGEDETDKQIEPILSDAP